MDGLGAMFMPKYLDEQMQQAADGESDIEGAEAFGQAGLAEMAKQVVSKFGRVSKATIKERRVADREEAAQSVHAALEHWIKFFSNNSKYKVVGTVVHDSGKPEPPALCEAAFKKRPTKGGKLEGIMQGAAMPGMAGGGDKAKGAAGAMPDFVKNGQAAGSKSADKSEGEGKDEL